MKKKRVRIINKIPPSRPAAVARDEPVEPGNILHARLAVAGGFVILMLLYYWMIGRFFPNAKGGLGPDYTYFVPALLDGYFWFHVNGLWHVPWFTPSFCGGSLVFPNLQRSFYSFPQLLTIFVDPFTAIKITVFLFAFLGGIGFYLFLRRVFLTPRWVAFLGGGLFLFNGFYSYRMIIGHFGYHTYMLIPFVALLLLRPVPGHGAQRVWKIIFDASVAGLLIALMATSDFITLLIPALLSVVAVGLIHGVLHGQRRDFWARLSLSCSLAVLITLSKLTAIISFMKHAPRSDYLLPGVDSLLHAFMLVARCLFFGAELDSFRGEWVRNKQWLIGQHEWEYSVSLVPLAFFLYGIIKLLRMIPRGVVASTLSRFKKYDRMGAIAIGVILVIPVFLNVYSPGWNAFLKKIPVIQSSSILFRWFILYIPLVIVTVALIMKHAIPRRFHAAICIMSLFCCIAVKASHRNSYYLEDSYDPRPIVKAYNDVKAGLFTPEITSMGLYQNEHGEPQFPINRNDTFTKGISQILAYESLFGYRLEHLPLKTLHPGPALDTSKGVLNVKNPATYLWPDENHAQPGDHFKIDEIASARAFLQYKPFPFQMPFLQTVANWTSLGILIAVVLFQVVFLGRKLCSHWFSGSPLLVPHPPRSQSGSGREEEPRMALMTKSG